jgi:hypothetical protein
MGPQQIEADIAELNGLLALAFGNNDSRELEYDDESGWLPEYEEPDVLVEEEWVE